MERLERLRTSGPSGALRERFSTPNLITACFSMAYRQFLCPRTINTENGSAILGKVQEASKFPEFNNLPKINNFKINFVNLKIFKNKFHKFLSS